MMGTGQTTPRAPAGSRELDAKVDFGASGDGRTDDADALQEGILAAASEQRKLFIPRGTYGLGHGLTLPNYCRVGGAGGFIGETTDGPRYGTILRALPGFVNLNPEFEATRAWAGISRIPAGLIQSETWAPDPTGAGRWAFDTPGRDYWFGARLRDLTLDGQGIAGLNGVCVDCPGENSVLENVVVQNCASGMWFTGGCTGFSVRDSSIWHSTDHAVKATSNPYFWKMQRRNPSGANWVTTGNLRFFGISGDNNGPGFFYNTQPASFCVFGLKYESPRDPYSSVILYDVDPTVRTTFRGGCRDGNRSAFVIVGGIAQGRINYGAFAGRDGYAFAQIKRTGSMDCREWSKPAIKVSGVQSHFPLLVVDKTFQRWGSNQATEKEFGIAAAETMCQVNNPFGDWEYCNDGSEKKLVGVQDVRFAGTTVFFPDGSRNTIG